MLKLKTIMTFIFLISLIPIFAQENDKAFNEMLSLEDSTYQEILDFISIVKNPVMKQKLTDALNSVNKFFENFTQKAKELTADITDPKELFDEKINLADSFDELLDKKFDAIDDKLKKATTLDEYRLKWFERVIYIFLKAKIQAFNYSITYKENKSDQSLGSYKKKFEQYLSDLLTFIYKNRELYKENSVYIKKIFMIEDTSDTGASAGYPESQVIGDLDLLFEFLKGRFKDYQGLYVKYASFKQSEIETTKSQGMLIYMSYQPITKDVKIKDIRTIEVAVTGDNLEDIVTFTLNQASNLVSTRVASDKSIAKLRTDEINYKKLTEESLAASKVAILKVELIYKKEVQPEKKSKEEEEQTKKEEKKKTLEVGLRLKVGIKQ